MNLSDILNIKHPDADFSKDIIIQDDGQGPYIAHWNSEIFGPQPTEQSLLDEGLAYNLQYLQKQIELELRDLIDSKPKEKGYDNILTLSSYTTSGNPQWKAEADAFIAWRDSLFAYAYQVLADVQQGNQEAPTIQEFLDGAPELVWP